jgi:ribosomal protein L44E
MGSYLPIRRGKVVIAKIGVEKIAKDIKLLRLRCSICQEMKKTGDCFRSGRRQVEVRNKECLPSRHGS